MHLNLVTFFLPIVSTLQYVAGSDSVVNNRNKRWNMEEISTIEKLVSPTAETIDRYIAPLLHPILSGISQ